MNQPLAVVTGFARALRHLGVAADGTRLGTAVEALSTLGPDDTYWALRLSLCADPDDLPKFDGLFDAWFRAPRPAIPTPARQAPPRLTAVRPLIADTNASPAEEPDDEPLRTAAAGTEILRHRDVADLTDAERDEVHRLIALLAPRVGTRRTQRRRPGGRARIDLARTVRRMLRDGGEPGELRYQRRRRRPRRLVLLLDISGSMAPYADALLRFAHAAVRVAPASTEVFTMGTRLTRVTRQLRLRDPQLALAAAGRAIPDWSGGTLLGEAVRAFLNLWGQRGTARGAVVVVASDGWERGDAALLGEQAQRLHRLAHRVVWVNPHRGKDGYQPVQQGVLAVLPHVDDFLAGHSLATFSRLLEVLADA